MDTKSLPWIFLAFVLGAAAMFMGNYFNPPTPPPPPSTLLEETLQADRIAAYKRAIDPKLIDLAPHVISVGGKTLVHIPQVSYSQNALNVKIQLYDYRDGKLMRIPQIDQIPTAADPTPAP